MNVRIHGTDAAQLVAIFALFSCSSASAPSSQGQADGGSDGGLTGSGSGSCCADPAAQEHKGSMSGVYCELDLSVFSVEKEGRPCFFTTAAAKTLWSSLDLVSCDGYLEPQPCVKATNLADSSQCCADDAAIASKGASGKACLNPPGHACTFGTVSTNATTDCTTWPIPQVESSTGLATKTCW